MSETVVDVVGYGLANLVRSVRIGSRCGQRWWSARTLMAVIAGMNTTYDEEDQGSKDAAEESSEAGGAYCHPGHPGHEGSVNVVRQDESVALRGIGGSWLTSSGGFAGWGRVARRMPSAGHESAVRWTPDTTQPLAAGRTVTRVLLVLAALALVGGWRDFLGAGLGAARILLVSHADYYAR
jgi:hypothetical protein